MASVLCPCADSSSAAVRTVVSFESANATAAPDSAKAFAVARPNPDPAPVISATLFSKDMFITSPSSRVELWLMGTLFEHILRDGHRRKNIGPADIKCQLRDCFRGLRLRQAIVHRPVQVRGKLRSLCVGDQRADRDEAAVSWSKVGA